MRKMVRRTGTLAICVLAMLAISVVAASGAWATAPEYGRCVKVAKGTKGKFATAKCTTAATAEKFGFEWDPGAVKTKFTTSGGAGLLETTAGSAVTCEAESSNGELVAGGDNKEERGTIVKFTGCKALGLACTTAGAASGELITNELEGLVGWENKALKKTDLELFPAKSVTSGLFIEFECSGLVIKVRGKVLVPIKNDAMKSTETLTFIAKKGKQKPEKWEESSEKAVLESSFSNFHEAEFVQAGQTIKTTIVGEEKLELNAVV